ncbi:Integrase catalytic domain-containing protein [Mycena sanguinolenta]|uniref:Integrase catalytic domain-containing protein n=1 Tax=Mycena sanguinolenta TaxID=230812 RepID=A0A8H7CI82_9AGAR|nr:Integrase catalytic domain-containing protein [Mycena sanguinolenta]
MAHRSRPLQDNDPVHSFLTHAARIMQETQFIIDSLPNVEMFSVEHTLRQLHAVHYVLINLDDDWLEKDEVEGLIDSVVASGLSLERFQTTPPPPRNIGTSRDVHTGGRSRYVLDLDCAIELHAMGNPWDAVADALGVCRCTLYYHLERAGLSPERPAFTEMDDEMLDEHVAEISLKHPLAGKSIVQGHLKAQGLHIPVACVQESLRRVDAIGVIVR